MHRLAPLLAAGCLLVFAACSNEIDPLDESKGQFSIYGALEIGTRDNVIRVRDLNEPFVAESTRTLDATVTLTDLERGTTETLRDTVVRFDGLPTHNFRSALAIRPQTRYRVSVEAPGRGPVTATATTPRRTELEVRPTGRTCNVPIRLTFAPIDDPEDLDVEIGFDYDGRRYWTRLPFVDRGSDDRITTSFVPLSVLDRAFGACQPPSNLPRTVWCDDLDSETFYLRFTHFGTRSGGTSDADIDVPGGAGNLVGVQQEQTSFPISDALCASGCGDTCQIPPPR